MIPIDKSTLPNTQTRPFFLSYRSLVARVHSHMYILSPVMTSASVPRVRVSVGLYIHDFWDLNKAAAAAADDFFLFSFLNFNIFTYTIIDGFE